MAIRSLRIRNYRSIATLDLDLGPMNAVIGPNNSGKSNILRALNCVLGETWPTRPFSEKDVHRYDPNATIEVTVIFDQPLTSDPQVDGFRLSYSPQTETEYVAVDGSGNPIVARGYPKRVNRAMRDEVALLYLDLERQADRQLRPTQWTLYGKLLRQIEGALPASDRQQFRQAVANAFATHIRPGLTQAEQIIDAFVRGQTGLDVRLDFQLLHPIELLKAVRPYIVDSGMTFDVEDVGAGAQSAVAVAVAKAYAEIVRRPLLLAIEEPELYLHPHGCRHFYRLLRELSAQGLQIVYSTHERAFLNAGEFQEIHIVRKTGGGTDVNSGNRLALTGAQARLRLQTKFNEKVNEVFFASCVVLVEADPDEVACRCALELNGLELDKQSISVISLGGIGEIPFVAELLVGLDIPTLALTDEDPGNATTAQTRTRIEQIIGQTNSFIQTPNLETLFGLPRKPSRIDAITTFPAWFANPANSCPQVYIDLAARIGALL